MSGGTASYLYARVMQEFQMMLETKASIGACNSIQTEYLWESCSSNGREEERK